MVVTEGMSHHQFGGLSIKLARILDSPNLELLEIVVGKSNTF
jgi:hypothetical protein